MSSDRQCNYKLYLALRFKKTKQKQKQNDHCRVKVQLKKILELEESNTRSNTPMYVS